MTCDIGDTDWDFSRCKIVVARKVHNCCECKDTIRVERGDSRAVLPKKKRGGR